MQSYKELLVWQKATEPVVAIYRITRGCPKSEVYGLASQMQRAIACGPLTELETQIEISDRLGYLPPDEKPIITQANEVGRMPSGLRQSLRAKIGTEP